jgi:hypothetical protein
MNPTPFNTDPRDPLVCPNCRQTIIQAAGVSPGHSGTIRKGGVFICASCGQASLVGDSQLDPITQDKFSKLPTNVQQAIQGIVRTLQDVDVKTTDLN